jgi:DNA-binding LacI/PurR family transcriptional regulator/DNA-binding transcriptional regulator YhcF (GntR family)
MIGFKRSDPTPVYLQIKASLQREIAEGRFAPGDPLPTERDLAMKLKLNRLTVRRALVELAREGFICRIPGRGTFLPGGDLSHSAKIDPPAATASDAMTIVLAAPFDDMPRDGSSFYFRAIQGMEGACPSNVSLALRRTTGDGTGLLKNLRADASIRGVIVMGLLDPYELAQLSASELPTVVFDCSPPPEGSSFDVVTHANEDGMRQAVYALVDSGHRDIACLVHATSNDPATAIASSVSSERRRGYELGLTSRNLPVRPELFIPVVPSCAAGYSAAQQMFRSLSSAPTAIVCTVDELAVGAVAGCKDLGLRVPEQVSVVGFGDLGLFSMPSVSTVRMQIEASGRAAVQLLLERIADPTLKPRTIVLPTEYIGRGTTSLPRIVSL